MYYSVEFISTIYIGVEAETEEDAQLVAELVIDDMQVQEEFSLSATCEGIFEIDEDEYNYLTLKADEL